MPNAIPATATIAGTTTFGNGLVIALTISSRFSSARVGGLSISRPISEERRDALVHGLDVRCVALVGLAAGRLRDLLELVLRAGHVGPVGDGEHTHARGRIALVERLRHIVERR